MLAESSPYGSFHNCSKIISWVTTCLLADASRQVVTHEIIFEQLWKEPYGDDSANMIWCFVRRLRKKMEKTEPEAAKIIQSIRKVGYYLDIDRY